MNVVVVVFLTVIMMMEGIVTGFVVPSSCNNLIRPFVPKNHGVSSSSLKMVEMEDFLFAAQSTASDLASTVLNSEGGGNVAVLYVAGLLTSISPCSLGLLPLTVSYISSATGDREDKTALMPTLAYAAGLSTVFCILGLSVALVGQSIMGGNSNDTIRNIGAILANGIAVIMGCQLLNILNLPLPSLEFNVDIDDKNDDATKLLGIFLLGGSSALIASPCATPVLTTLLAYIATMNNISYGAILILVYTLGYSTPLLLVGATGGQFLANLSSNNDRLQFVGQAVTPATAAVLIWYGTNGMLTTLFGDPSLIALTPILE